MLTAACSSPAMQTSKDAQPEAVGVAVPTQQVTSCCRPEAPSHAMPAVAMLEAVYTFWADSTSSETPQAPSKLAQLLGLEVRSPSSLMSRCAAAASLWAVHPGRGTGPIQVPGWKSYQ